jgi:flagellar assembly factor FliW
MQDEIRKTRRIETMQFGELEVEPAHIFLFNEGLLGFEDFREFVLVSEEQTVPFKWLISVEEPEIGFPLLSPWHLDMTYEPGRDFDFNRHVAMVVITLEDEKGFMTANMKAPIILDVADQTGRQLIIPSDKYSPTFVIPKKRT